MAHNKLPHLVLVILMAVPACAGAARKAMVEKPTAPLLASTGPIATGTDDPVVDTRAVIEASANLHVTDVKAALAELHAFLSAQRGYFADERTDGAPESLRATLTVRVPSSALAPFWQHLDTLGEVSSKHVKSTDVGKTLFDQETELANLSLTLDRMRKLLARSGLAMKDVLDIEKEMTRLRGEIDRIGGEKRYLENRVDYATVALSVRRKRGGGERLRAKAFPGPRLAVMSLLSPGGRDRHRLGVGLAFDFVPRSAELRPARSSLEVDLYEDVDGSGHAVLATMGAAMYSDFLGGGRNRFLNPYVGFRMGYGYIDGSRFVVGADLGVELVRHDRFVIDANLRLLGTIGRERDAMSIAGVSALLAF